MISESEIIRRIKISDLGSMHKWYADEIIEKYKIAAKSRLKYPTLTQKWTIDNQSSRGSAYFDEIEFMIKTESELEQFLGGVYPTSARQTRSRKTFWERIDKRIEGNPKFSIYNKKIKEDEEKILAENLKEEQRQNELRIKQFVSNSVVITPKVVAPKVVAPKVVETKVVETKVVDPVIVASSSLLPLGIIGLLLYTSMGKK